MDGARIRVIDAATLRSLLPWAACIEAMRGAMIATSERRVLLPLRQGMPLPNGAGTLGMMPGYLGEPECFGIKLVSLFPGNRARGLSTHLGAYLLYRADDGMPLALMNASELTAIRTAATSALATVVLMRPDSATLVIIGTGEQARAHIEALLTAHPFRRVLIWGRAREHAAALAAACAPRSGAEFEVLATVEQAVAAADVVCTVTSSPEPVLYGRWLRPGMHVNLVGSSTPQHREVDDDCVARSRFFVDYRESTLAQAGEFLHALRAGRVTEAHIRAELGEVLSGRQAGRETAGDITVYKSLGIAAQDLAAAWHVYDEAERRNLGTIAAL